MATYNYGVRSFHAFCTRDNVPCLPLCEHTLIRYVTSMAPRVSQKTIKIYLSGVQFWSITLGHYITISSFPRLYYTLRGIRRLQGTRFTRPRRQPILLRHLRLIHFRVRFQAYTPGQHIMFRTMASTAYFGLLRCSEYTSANRITFDPDSTLLVSDVSFNDDYSIMVLIIKASKTDPFRVGTQIRIGAVGGYMCPVTLMRRYLRIHPGSGPLFQLEPGRYLVRNDVVVFLRRVLPNIPNINTHSFLIGGASAAASAGIPDSQIQILGRWSSDAYRRYLHLSDDAILQLSQALRRPATSARLWDPVGLTSRRVCANMGR